MAAQLVNGGLDLRGDGAAVAAVRHKGGRRRAAAQRRGLAAVPCASVPTHFLSQRMAQLKRTTHRTMSCEVTVAQYGQQSREMGD